MQPCAVARPPVPASPRWPQRCHHKALAQLLARGHTRILLLAHTSPPWAHSAHRRVPRHHHARCPLQTPPVTSHAVTPRRSRLQARRQGCAARQNPGYNAWCRASVSLHHPKAILLVPLATASEQKPARSRPLLSVPPAQLVTAQAGLESGPRPQQVTRAVTQPAPATLCHPQRCCQEPASPRALELVAPPGRVPCPATAVSPRRPTHPLRTTMKSITFQPLRR